MVQHQDFVQTRQKEYLQYRMAAILGLQIVLPAVGTPGYVNDTVMLPYNIRHHEFHLKGRRVNTDRVHNSDQNCQGNDTQQQAEEGYHQSFQAQQKKGGHAVQPK